MRNPVPIEVDMLPLTVFMRCGKEEIFLARARHATVIQMKLNYSSVGPLLLCDHICCCAGTFKLGHYPLQVLSHSQFAPCGKKPVESPQSQKRFKFSRRRLPEFGTFKRTSIFWIICDHMQTWSLIHIYFAGHLH